MKAYELLDSAEKWTRGMTGMDARGHAVTGADPEAVAWCIAGALEHCYWAPDLWLEARDQVKKVLREVFDWSYGIALFNDSPDRTFEDIQRVLKIADV